MLKMFSDENQHLFTLAQVNEDFQCYSFVIFEWEFHRSIEKFFIKVLDVKM